MVILDIHECALATCDYLLTSMIPDDSVYNDLAADLEQCISELVIIEIQNHKALILPDAGLRTCDPPIARIAERWNSLFTELSDWMLEVILLNMLLDKVRTLVKVNPYASWNLSKRQGLWILEDLGDFRILEWEKDHMVDGVYK